MKKQGFTLIELVMVIVIIGILAAVAIPRFASLRSDARKAACDGNTGAIRGALSAYYAKGAVSNSWDGTPGGAGGKNASGFPKSIAGGTLFAQCFLLGQVLPECPLSTSTWYKTAPNYNSTTGVLQTHTAAH